LFAAIDFQHNLAEIRDQDPRVIQFKTSKDLKA
jgi:hypothetical protein